VKKFVPLGCNIDDEENLPLVGAQVNIFPTCILQAQNETFLLPQLPKKKNVNAHMKKIN
jgi:hypothetical protein